jgi:hypothetical protein
MADFTYQKTALDVVKGAMSACDMREPSTAAASTDPKVKRFWRLVSEVGRDIAQAFDWQVLRKEWTLTTDGVTLAYPTPDDFDGFVDLTGWNKTNRQPLIGPSIAQSWQKVQGTVSGSTLTFVYKYDNDKITFQSLPPTAQSITFIYQTSSWVQDAASPTVVRDHVENDGDIILLYGRMMEAALVLRWKLDRGLDTSGANNTFNSIVESVTGRQSPGQVYFLGASYGPPLISTANVPSSGIGL